MAKADDDEELPDAGESLRQLARLAALWRRADFALGLTPVHWETLRYLQLANRYSNTPGALADYLGATKGTTSQTLSLLEKKGLVSKSERDDDKRSVSLTLTDTAHAMLAEDQRHRSSDVVYGLKPKTQKRLARAIDALVAAEALRLSASSFGLCSSCRYFREASRDASARCMKFEADITEDDSRRICAAHQAR